MEWKSCQIIIGILLPPSQVEKGKAEESVGISWELMEPNSLPTQIKICQFGFSLEICVEHSGWTFMVNAIARVSFFFMFLSILRSQKSNITIEL